MLWTYRTSIFSGFLMFLLVISLIICSLSERNGYEGAIGIFKGVSILSTWFPYGTI